MQEINAWLHNGQEFTQGVKLYTEHGKNSFFKKLLLAGPTPYTIEKLEAELRSLAPAPPAIQDKPKQFFDSNQPPVGKTEADLVDQESSSEDFTRYLQLKEHQKTLYRQLERNMIELDLSENERIRHMTAKNILGLNSKIQDIYKLIDLFDEKGKFPTEKEQVTRTAADEIQLLRVSNWKANQRLQSKKCRDVLQTKKLIEDNNKRIIELGGTVKI
jgi:hypothetical protein